MSEATESSPNQNWSDSELRTELTRHGISVGPIVPSTRNIYQKKLQNMLGENGMNNSEILMNGTTNGEGTAPLRETTPLMSDENEISPRPTPRATPVPNEHGSDDDDEPSESVRLLTPGEIRNFSRSFKTDSPEFVFRQRRDRRECSPQLGNANSMFVASGVYDQNTNTAEGTVSSVVKRFGISMLLMALTGALLVGMFWMRERVMPIFDDVKKGQ